MIICSSLQIDESSLMVASENGHVEVVRMLLSAGANVQDMVSQSKDMLLAVDPGFGAGLMYSHLKGLRRATWIWG